MSNEARKKDENRREAYASKRMHSFVLCSFLTFVLVASILPVQSAMATDVVFDDFSGTTLETTRWSVLKGGSYINVGDGELDMTSDGHKRIDSIATFGPGNSAETRMKLNGDYQKFGFRINPHGYSPTIVGFYFDTLEAAYGGEEDYIHALVWEKTSEGMTKLLDQSIPATWNEWHIFEIVWKSDEVLFLVDDVTSASVSFAYSGNLPVGFWNDRSSTMLVDWVLVTPLVGLTLDQISTDFSISANDFCTEHNEYETIAGLKMKNGLLYSSSIFTTSSDDQRIGIFILNRGAGNIDFNAAKPSGDTIRPFDVRTTPKDASADFNNLGWGGTFSEGDALIGCIEISNLELQNEKANIHLDLDFGRGDTIYTIGINIHVRA